MVDERTLLLARLRGHQDRWDKVISLVGVTIGKTNKNEALLAILAIAEEALAL